MSLPQLVGLKCVLCSKGIASNYEGAFCENCGNPVHSQCVATPSKVQSNCCDQCGGDPKSTIAMEVRGDWEAEYDARAKGKACPFCGSADVVGVPPPTYVAFADDRFCNRCRTQYILPTPMWAAIVFILLGVAFFLVGIGGILLIGFAIETGAPAKLFAPLIPLVMGSAMFIYGVRSLTKSGITIRTPNHGDSP